MIVKAIHPSIEGNIRSFLTVKAASGQADLTVKNVTGFSANDFVVIGKQKEDLTEIRRISSISGKVITLSSNLSNTHASNSTVTIIKYDQVKFYKASSIDGTYTAQSTKDLAIDEEHTLYDDTSALSTDYYKIKYYNSYLDELSVFSDPIGTSGFKRYSLIRIQDQLYRKMGDKKEQYFERDEITDWANEVKDDMVNQIIDSNEKYFNNYENLSVDSEGEASLNADFRKFQKVFVLYDGTNGKRGKKFELEDINDWTQVFNQTFPGYYFRAYKIGVRPKGTVGTTLIQVHFEDQPDDLENDSDELSKPLRFYMHVFMDGLMAKASEKSGKTNQAAYYWKRYEKGVQSMLEEINNIVLDENRGIRDDEENSEL
ncbi:MAG: hypothetical protein KDD35_08090 [Bdellovibrionales bacterium]|nr:hypothetical protein [Bdellovibrionales bacterium]